MYLGLYDLIMTYVYGGVTSVTPDMELVATLVATFGCLFFVALPFLLLWKVVKIFA